MQLAQLAATVAATLQLLALLAHRFPTERTTP
jgi:hypothetical protein